MAGDNQGRILSEAMKIVKQEARDMKLQLDDGKIMDALKHASTLLSELRTSLMHPKTYYELYISITDEMRHLEAYLLDEFSKGNKVNDLYELVQYAGNIVPRLYLLITVGSVYVKAKEVASKDILRDLVEMCRGVQHPLRGLFLRNYLLSCLKGELPTVAESSDGTLSDSIQFILLNFSEMNKLWVRMQHQGHSRDKHKREQERLQLRLLVGTNLVRLSSLDGVNLDIYQNRILPSILEQVKNCRDAIAQEYLLECTIQVFPDDFHLQTLTEFLGGCKPVDPRVNITSIVSAMIDRLAAYIQQPENKIPENVNLFEIFHTQITALVEARPSTAAEDVVCLQAALASLCLSTYPDELEYMDRTLEFVVKYLQDNKLKDLDQSTAATSELIKLFKLVLDKYPNINTCLKLASHSKLYSFFNFSTKHTLSVTILNKIIENNDNLHSADELELLFSMLKPLLEDDKSAPEDFWMEGDFETDQTLVASFISQLKLEDADVMSLLLGSARKVFFSGGDRRMKFTLPSLVFQACRLGEHFFKTQAGNWESSCEDTYKFVRKTISKLADSDFSHLSIKLFLQAALSVNNTRFEQAEELAYDFFSQALHIYENSIADSNEQASMIALITGTLQSMKIFTSDNFMPLSSKCALQSSRLVQKSSQARAVCRSAVLFWNRSEEEGREDMEKQTSSCLTKAVKVSKSILEPAAQVATYVEILNNYVVFLKRGYEHVSVAHINKIAEMIQENLPKIEEEDEKQQIEKFYKNTLNYISSIKDTSEGAAFKDFVAPDSEA